MNVLEKLNKIHAVVRIRGKVLVAYIRKDGVDFLKEEDFVRMYSNKRCRGKSLGAAWLQWEGRRQHLGGVTFSPDREVLPRTTVERDTL